MKDAQDRTLRQVADARPELWRSLKAEAARRGVTLRGLTTDILEEWLRRNAQSK